MEITELSKCANKFGTDKGTGGFSDAMGMGTHYGYTEYYDRYFQEYKNQESINVLEIGVWHGGSLKMYDEYFGKKCQIYGLDIDDKSEYNTENIHTYIVNQSKEEELNNFVKEMEEKGIKFDIIIDDGSHLVYDQILTLKIFSNLVKNNGIYIIEDLHYNFTQLQYDSDFFMKKSPISYLLTLNKNYALDDKSYFNLLGRIEYTNIISIPSTIISNDYKSNMCNTSIIKFK